MIKQVAVGQKKWILLAALELSSDDCGPRQGPRSLLSGKVKLDQGLQEFTVSTCLLVCDLDEQTKRLGKKDDTMSNSNVERKWNRFSSNEP
jgi:hypothetical protein